MQGNEHEAQARAESGAAGEPGPRPLRVLLIGSLPPPIGGSAVLFRQLAAELSTLPGVEPEVIDTMRRGRGGPLARAWWAWRTALACLAAIRRADVVSFHASTPGTVWIAPWLALACRWLGRPFLLREFGGSLDAEYQEMGALRRRLVRLAFRGDRVLLETHALVRFFEGELPDARCVWYSNSRPLAPAAAPEARSGADAVRFVFVGHVKASKGLHEILACAQRIQGCHVDVYGPFHDGFSQREFDASPRVRYCGELAPEEVIPTLRRYDAVLLPTWHFGEGYPGIVLEAYAAGRPVVASRWRSIPEIVEDGVSGLLVEPRSAGDLGRALEQLLADPALRARLAEGARLAAARFASTRWTDAFAAICRELASERAPG